MIGKVVPDGNLRIFEVKGMQARKGEVWKVVNASLTYWGVCGRIAEKKSEKEE